MSDLGHTFGWHCISQTKFTVKWTVNNLCIPTWGSRAGGQRSTDLPGRCNKATKHVVNYHSNNNIYTHDKLSLATKGSSLSLNHMHHLPAMGCNKAPRVPKQAGSHWLVSSFFFFFLAANQAKTSNKLTNSQHSDLWLLLSVWPILAEPCYVFYGRC